MTAPATELLVVPCGPAVPSWTPASTSDPRAWVALVDARAAVLSLSLRAALSSQPDDVDVVVTGWYVADDRHRLTHRHGRLGPERLRWRNSVGPLLCVRQGALATIGWRWSERSAIHDAALRVLEHASELRVAHLDDPMAEIAADAYEPEDARCAADVVADHLRRIGVSAAVSAAGHSPEPMVEVRRSGELPGVSLIVPTSGTRAVIGGVERRLVVALAESLAITDYPAELVELVLVVGPEADPVAVDEVRRVFTSGALRIVTDDGPFGHSRRTNLGAVASSGDVLVLLNDDTAVISPDWLREIALAVSEDGVGTAAPVLLYEDGSIQSAGHAHPPGNIGSPPYPIPPSQMFEYALGSDVSGVTLACGAVRRSVFEAHGGLSPQIHNALNDVDFSFKLARSGLRHVSLGAVRMHHFESKSRTRGVHQFERETVRARWGSRLHVERFHAPDRAVDTEVAGG